ncbi:MAG: transglutaminase family protein [Myxococcales bacterium]
MPAIEELWSQAHEARLTAFVEAAGRSELVGALHALEGATAQERAQDALLLQGWAHEVASLAHADAANQADALAAVLGERAGFAGATDDYLHPDHSHLHKVLSTRRGLPILLSVVWMEVGRRSGIDVAGIGLPGHFIVQVGGRDGPYADPFAGGRRLSVAECKERVARSAGGELPWRDEFLRPVPARAILERVLRNLMTRYSRSDEPVELYRTLNLLCALTPDQPRPLLQRAAIADRLGARDRAIADYEQLTQRFEGTEEGRHAAKWLAENRVRPLLH